MARRPTSKAKRIKNHMNMELEDKKTLTGTDSDDYIAEG